MLRVILLLFMILENNIFDSVSIMDHSKKPIVIKEVSP